MIASIPKNTGKFKRLLYRKMIQNPQFIKLKYHVKNWQHKALQNP